MPDSTATPQAPRPPLEEMLERLPGEPPMCESCYGVGCAKCEHTGIELMESTPAAARYALHLEERIARVVGERDAAFAHADFLVARVEALEEETRRLREELRLAARRR